MRFSPSIEFWRFSYNWVHLRFPTPSALLCANKNFNDVFHHPSNPQVRCRCKCYCASELLVDSQLALWYANYNKKWSLWSGFMWKWRWRNRLVIGWMLAFFVLNASLNLYVKWASSLHRLKCWKFLHCTNIYVGKVTANQSFRNTCTHYSTDCTHPNSISTLFKLVRKLPR